MNGEVTARRSQPRQSVSSLAGRVSPRSLATELTIGGPLADAEYATTADLDGEPLSIGVKRLATG